MINCPMTVATETLLGVALRGVTIPIMETLYQSALKDGVLLTEAALRIWCTPEVKTQPHCWMGLARLAA